MPSLSNPSRKVPDPAIGARLHGLFEVTGERHVSYLLLLAKSVFLPEFASICDVPLLASFRPTAKQDYQGVSVSAEIDSVAGADIDAILQHATANASHIGQVASLHSGQGRSYPDRCAGIKTVEPSTERTASPAINVFSEFNHKKW